MELHNLTNTPGARSRRKRVGRGCGSGMGKTSTRGHKGAGARKGHKHKLTFEGGQMPLVRRLPKRGFNNARFNAKALAVNVSDLEKKFEAGAEVTVETQRPVSPTTSVRRSRSSATASSPRSSPSRFPARPPRRRRSRRPAARSPDALNRRAKRKGPLSRALSFCRFPTPRLPSGTSTRPQPSFNSFIATDKQNPSPTIFQPPRHRAAKWLDIRSHEEAPTLIQPFPNPDIGIVSRNSTTTIAQPRPNHDPTPQDGYLRSRRQICRDCAYPPRNSV